MHLTEYGMVAAYGTIALNPMIKIANVVAFLLLALLAQYGGQFGI